MVKTEEKRRKEQEHKDKDYQPATTSHLQGQQTGLDVESGTSSDRRTSGESLQQVIQFQKHQIEEKKVKTGGKDNHVGAMLSSYLLECFFIYAFAEKRIRKEERRGAARSCPLGFGSYGSADGEAAGQTEQTAETSPRQHQHQTCCIAETVSIISKTHDFHSVVPTQYI